MEYKAKRKMVYGDRTYEANQIVPVKEVDAPLLKKYLLVEEVKVKKAKKKKA